MDINSPIEALPGIGKKRAELYHKLGIHTMEELIFYFPRDYIDYTTPVPIGEAPINEHSVISAVIKQKLPAARIRPGLTLYKLVGADDTDSVTITYYNNPYAAEKLTVGTEYRFFGRVTGGFMRKEMNSPQYIGPDEQCMCRPVYKLTEGLTANMLTQNMLAALKCVGDDHPDPLPAAIRQK
ncbi:MAG: ATP-dependent DNA helicase RecG, partial [Oscillospiraceae bacterium]|nr:ATP-dependent DNA helicase RecG [Oscillospiraceae bacterium]